MSNSPNISMSIINKLEMLQKMDGYCGAGVFTSDGKMLGGVTEVSGVNFEIAGELFHDVLLIADNRAKEAGFGNADLLQVNTERGIIFGKCFNEGGVHFHAVLVIDKDANVAMAKLLLQKFMESLKDELTEVKSIGL
jgi:roadblock/LC7 domain-containing protein